MIAKEGINSKISLCVFPCPSLAEFSTIIVKISSILNIFKHKCLNLNWIEVKTTAIDAYKVGSSIQRNKGNLQTC